MGTTKADKQDVRRITQNSTGTSSISIPINYMRLLSWHKGQHVRLVRKGRQLLIQPVRH